MTGWGQSREVVQNFEKGRTLKERRNASEGCKWERERKIDRRRTYQIVVKGTLVHGG